MYAYLDCCHRTIEDHGDLFVAQFLIYSQHKSFSLQLWQFLQRTQRIRDGFTVFRSLVGPWYWIDSFRQLTVRNRVSLAS